MRLALAAAIADTGAGAVTRGCAQVDVIEDAARISRLLGAAL